MTGFEIVHWRQLSRVCAIAMLAATIASGPSLAQDIRGFENCMAEKDMARRTGCMQSNGSLLNELLTKEIRRAQAAEGAAAKDIAALKSDLAAMKTALETAQREIAELKKQKPAEPAKK